MSTIIRTALFTPATRPERFAKAAAVGTDLLIIDLEDAVSPREKDAARAAAIIALSRPVLGATRYAVRINGFDTRAGLADMLALLQSRADPAFVVVPKTDSSAQLQILDRLMSEGGCATRLIGLIESAKAVREVHAIARSTPRLAALMLGAADLASDFGCGPDAPNLVHARVELISATVLAGIEAIDTPFFDLHDEPALRRDAQRAADMGFSGKAAIHPTHIATIRAAFCPSDGAIQRAHAILAACNDGVGTVDGRMVDAANTRHARRVLAAAGITGAPA